MEKFCFKIFRILIVSSTSLSLSRSKIRFFGWDTRSGLLANPSLLWTLKANILRLYWEYRRVIQQWNLLVMGFSMDSELHGWDKFSYIYKTCYIRRFQLILDHPIFGKHIQHWHWFVHPDVQRLYFVLSIANKNTCLCLGNHLLKKK